MTQEEVPRLEFEEKDRAGVFAEGTEDVRCGALFGRQKNPTH
jgi:hypothetical protein